jgi:hypothetical protein
MPKEEEDEDVEQRQLELRQIASRYFSKHLLCVVVVQSGQSEDLSFELHGVFIRLGHGLCVGSNLITKGPR